MTKKLSAFAMALALFVCAALLPAPGAQAATAVTARLRPDVTILIDGQRTAFYHVTGQQAHPVLYNGSTYLPLRAIGEIMGRNVDWNSSTKTATLAGERTTPPTVGTPDQNPSAAAVKATIQEGFTVVVDGETRVFRGSDLPGRQRQAGVPPAVQWLHLPAHPRHRRDNGQGRGLGQRHQHRHPERQR